MGIFPSVFNPKHYKNRSTATLTLSELASKKFQQSTDTERASPAQHQTANHKTANCFRKHWPQILTMLVSHHTSRQQLTSYTVSLRSKFSSVPEKKIRQFWITFWGALQLTDNSRILQVCNILFQHQVCSFHSEDQFNIVAFSQM